MIFIFAIISYLLQSTRLTFSTLPVFMFICQTFFSDILKTFAKWNFNKTILYNRNASKQASLTLDRKLIMESLVHQPLLKQLSLSNHTTPRCLLLSPPRTQSLKEELSRILSISAKSNNSSASLY